MIVTVTLNPSLDHTLTLDEPLTRGAVHRLTPVSTEPGGKGVNVSRALTQNGVDTVTLLPAADHDPILTGLRALRVPFHNVDIPGNVRSNLTITENDGTTTKLNEPGAYLDRAALATLTEAVCDHATRATWVVLSGSLPPGVPDGWYADVVARLAALPCRVAVDTSERPLTALADSFATAAPDLIIAEPRGWLVLEGEEGVRVQVDGRSPQTLPLRPLALSPGVHRVKTALSNQEVRVDSEVRISVAIKVSLVEQLLRDADDALTTQNLAKAQRHLDGAQRRLKAKPAASPALHISLLRLQGKLEMAREHWLDAITAFETLRNDYSSHSSPEVVETIKLLAQHVGRIEIERMENGRCKKTHEWVPPGENMVDLDGDRKEKVRVGPGKTANVGSCGGRR